MMNPSTCETDCELLDEATSGYLAVSVAFDPYQAIVPDPYQTCIAKLDTIRGDIPLQVSSSNVQKRNGSSARPINLPHLKTSMGLDNIIGQKADGSLVKIIPNKDSKKRFVKSSGKEFISLAEEILPDLFGHTLTVDADAPFLIGAIVPKSQCSTNRRIQLSLLQRLDT